MVKKVLSSPLKFRNWRVTDGKLYKYVKAEYPDLYGNCEHWKLVVPKEKLRKVVSDCHDPPTAGHLGIYKTYARLTERYYWPKMRSDVARYVSQKRSQNKMADDKEAKDESLRIICSYCKKSVLKKIVKCTVCDKNFHSSCYERVVCCGNRITPKNQEQEVKTNQEFISESDVGIKNLLLLNEKLKNENTILKEENYLLKQDIVKLEDTLSKLLEDHTNTPQKNLEVFTSDYNEVNIHYIVKIELESRLSEICKEVEKIKCKVDKLEINSNSIVIDKTGQKKSATKTSNKNYNVKPLTKTVYQNKQTTSRQKVEEINLHRLENRQQQIMNDIINLDLTPTPNPSIHLNVESNLEGINEGNINEDRQNMHDFQVISYKKKHNGRGEGQQSDLLKAAPKTNWVWIGQLEEESTLDNIKKYVEEKYPNKHIICFDLKSKRRQKCFKIGSPEVPMEDLLNPKLWPEGVLLRPFRVKSKSVNST